MFLNYALLCVDPLTQQKYTKDVCAYEHDKKWKKQNKNIFKISQDRRILPESRCQIRSVHILSPQTGLSTNHKLLLFFSSCIFLKHIFSNFNFLFISTSTFSCSLFNRLTKVCTGVTTLGHVGFSYRILLHFSQTPA